jgi:hypothetical protein
MPEESSSSLVLEKYASLGCAKKIGGNLTIRILHSPLLRVDEIKKKEFQSLVLYKYD